MKKLMIVSLALACVGIGCEPKKNNRDIAFSSVNSEEAVIESGITILSGMADEQSGSSLALESTPQKLDSLIYNTLFPKAYAVDCMRPVFEVCNSGQKIANYNACSVPTTSRLLDGHASLEYSNNNCLMSNVGDEVIRTFDIDIKGPRGGVVSLSSDVFSDYRGSSYGGGGRLTTTASGWDLDILGRHSYLVVQGRELFNVSTRTLSPVSVSGSLTRVSRNMDGGQIEVNHNIAKFTAVLEPNNLQWSGACCHPTSGSLNVSYSGSKTGSVTIEFAGSCGSATLNNSGQIRSIQLSYCE